MVIASKLKAASPEKNIRSKILWGGWGGGIELTKITQLVTKQINKQLINSRRRKRPVPRATTLYYLKCLVHRRKIVRQSKENTTHIPQEKSQQEELPVRVN